MGLTGLLQRHWQKLENMFLLKAIKGMYTHSQYLCLELGRLLEPVLFFYPLNTRLAQLCLNDAILSAKVEQVSIPSASQHSQSIPAT